MIAFVLAGVLFAGPRHRWEAAVLMAALVVPVPLVLALLGLIVAARAKPRLSPEIRFHQTVAARLRAGASLRIALADAAEDDPALELRQVARRLRAGHPVEELGPQTARRLPETGPLAAAAIEFSAMSGGGAIGAFEVMAEIAAEEMEVRREVAAGAAPAWLAVWIIGGAPVLVIGLLIVTGRVGRLLDSAGGQVSVAAGLMLVMAGVAAVGALARRALQ